MNVNKNWLKKRWGIYPDPHSVQLIEWFDSTYKDENIDIISVLKKLVEENRLVWANQLIVRVRYFMDVDIRFRLHIYVTELLLPIFEDAYPEDKTPRKILEILKDIVKNNFPRTATLSLLGTDSELNKTIKNCNKHFTKSTDENKFYFAILIAESLTYWKNINAFPLPIIVAVTVPNVESGSFLNEKTGRYETKGKEIETPFVLKAINYTIKLLEEYGI